MEDKLNEIATLEDGTQLWSEPYNFKRLSAVGEEICRDRVWYIVKSSIIEDGHVRTILRRL